MSRIFLPRIKEILKTRQTNIEHNNALAFELQEKINEIEEANKNLKAVSNSQYKTTIDQFIKEAALHKEEATQNLKAKISKITEASKNEIHKFKEESKEKRNEAIESLISQIDNKFLNKN